MPDVTDLLSALRPAFTPGPAGPDTAAADVARGRRALSRRRHRRLAGATGAAVIVAAVAVVVSQPAAQNTPRATSSSSASAGAMRLTAYTGTQPVGFEVATVPAGWQVVDSDDYSFVLAPPGSTPTPTSSPGGGVSLVGRIGVMLQGDSTMPTNEQVTTVTVNGQPGQLGLALGGIGNSRYEWLIYPDNKGHKVLIQLPVSLGLTTAQLVQFAEGITVTSAAKASGG